MGSQRKMEMYSIEISLLNMKLKWDLIKRPLESNNRSNGGTFSYSISAQVMANSNLL